MDSNFGPTRPASEIRSASPSQLTILLVVLLLLSGRIDALAETYVVPSQSYPNIASALSAVPTNIQFTEPHTIQVSPGTYLVTMTIADKLGTASFPLTIQANGGEVVIDGGNLLTATWTDCGNGIWSVPISPSNLPTPHDNDRVVVNGVRYTNVVGASDFCDVPTAPGQYSYDAVQQRLYARFIGGGDPNAKTIHILRRGFGIDIARSHHVTIDGIDVMRSRGKGINVKGTDSATRLQSINIRNSRVAYHTRHGIYLEFTSNCTIDRDTTDHNLNHGIYLLTTDHCAITHCRSFANDAPAPGILGDVAGMKIGDAPETAANVDDVTDITIDYNSVHDNEDTGINLKSSSNVLVRRNLSYGNGDHGYDNLNTDNTTFINNVAYGNDHNGISVEGNAQNVSVHNCILAYNALDAMTMESEEDIAEV